MTIQRAAGQLRVEPAAIGAAHRQFIERAEPARGRAPHPFAQAVALDRRRQRQRRMAEQAASRAGAEDRIGRRARVDDAIIQADEDAVRTQAGQHVEAGGRRSRCAGVCRNVVDLVHLASRPDALNRTTLTASRGEGAR
jgi:hypothetical protein